MQTILGAGGAVAESLAIELSKQDADIRLISRNEIKTSGKTTWRKADLLDFSSLRENAKGSKTIYLTAGLIYDKKIWKEQWPKVMDNAINLAKENNARLIFLDNVYMYGKVENIMNENSPYNPCSMKGEIRAKIARKLEEEWKQGNLRASIARAADFYGSKTLKSFFDPLVLSPISKKKKASWLGNPEKLHSFTLVEEAAKGMYLLGQDINSDQQIWHLPTATAIKGLEFIEISSKIFNSSPKFQRLSYALLWMASLVNREIRGSLEMFYQYEIDYIFDSHKFNQYFNFTPISYQDGIENLSKTLFQP